MANYFWVGGSGTWDATTATNWSLNSGGTGNAGVPGSSDTATFNSASSAGAYTVTISTNASCSDLSFAGPASGSLTVSMSATSVLNIYGNYTVAATNVGFSGVSGAIFNFAASTTGKTLTLNNASTGTVNYRFNSTTGGWSLASSATGSSLTTFTVVAGSFSTANFNLTCSQFASNGALTRSVSLGSSTVSCQATGTAWNFSTSSTGLTFSAGTSTIIVGNNSGTFNGDSLTYYNLSYTTASQSGLYNITGTNTFNNLSFTSVSAGIKRILFLNNQTVTGTMTCGTANAANIRISLASAIGGVPITLTVNAIATLSDVDFRDIVAAGASGTWSGTRLGNCGGNSNITFAAGTTKYWSLAGGGSFQSTAWALSSGGTPAINNFPLPQDSIIIDDAGLSSGSTITPAAYNLGPISFASRTLPVTLSFTTSTVNLHGDLTLCSAVTTTGTTATIVMSSTATITSAGVPLNCGLTINTGGTVTLNGNLDISGVATGIILTSGTFNLASYTLTTFLFASSNTNTRTLAFGTGKFVLTGNALTIWSCGTSTNMSVTGTTRSVDCTYTGTTGTRVLQPPSSVGEAGSISFNIIGAGGAGDIVSLGTTGGAFNNITFTTFQGSIITASSIDCWGSLTLSTGMTWLTSIYGIGFKATSGSKTFTMAGVTVTTSTGWTFGSSASTATFTLQDNLTYQSGITFSGGTLNLNNNILTCATFSCSSTTTRTIAFGTGKFVLTGTNANIWTTQTATNLTLTGTPRVEVTGAGTTGQTRTIDAGFSSGTETNSPSFYVSAGVDNVSFLGTSRKYGTIDLTGFAGNWQSDNWQLTIYGNLVLPSGLLGITTSTSFTGPIIFGSTSATQRTVTTASKLLPIGVTFSGVGGSWQLQDSLTVASTFTTTLTAGTLDINGKTLSTGLFNSSGSTARTLGFGTSGTITVTGTSFNTSTSTNLTVTGSASTINMTSASAKTFTVANTIWPVELINSGVGALTLNGSFTVNKFTNSSIPGTITLTSGITPIMSAFDVNGTAGNLITINATTPGSKATLKSSNNSTIFTSDFLNLQDIYTSNGALWFAGKNSVIGTNVIGWATTQGEFLQYF